MNTRIKNKWRFVMKKKILEIKNLTKYYGKVLGVKGKLEGGGE